MYILNRCVNILLLVCAIYYVQCASPQKAYDRGNYMQSMRLAAKKIKNNKDVASSYDMLHKSAVAFTEQTIAAHSNANVPVKILKRDQKRLYNALKKLDALNNSVHGELQQYYNNVCDVKYIIDLAIVNNYYLRADSLIQNARIDGVKESARAAYPLYEKSKKEGAHLFYVDVDQKMEECVVLGTITVHAPAVVSINNKFVKRVDINRSADCTITYDQGFLVIDTDIDTETEELSKMVVTGQETIRDTSGIVLRTDDIKEKVFATRTIREIEVSGSQTLYIHVTANTEECFLKSTSETFHASESCEEVKLSGDSRAFDGLESSCYESNLRSQVEQEISRDLSRGLCIY